MKKEVDEILRGIVHPETGRSLAEPGMTEGISLSGERIAITLVFERNRDPFMNSIKRQLTARLEEVFPSMKGKIFVYVKEAPKKEPGKLPEKKEFHGTAAVKKIIAVSSGKGGVGKSTVTSNLAVTLAEMGYKVGILDADIYGPSQPGMLGVEGYAPPAVERDGQQFMVPTRAHGVEVMSIGFFIRPHDALVWRGPMATGALKQLIHQTEWGELDILLIDMPPGTGDVHLTILQDLKVDGAVIVSTPQKVALADVTRGIEMFRSKNISVPVLGIIENMAWFTPAELPGNRYYIFGRGGAEALARQEGLPLLGRIPLVQSIMEGSEKGEPGIIDSGEVKACYRQIADNIVDKL